MGRALQLLLLLACVTFCGALYTAKDNIVLLEDEESIAQSDQPMMVEFFAPWCGHCKQLAPEYKTAAKKLEGSGAVLAAVDCDVHKALCGKYDIKGFPTLKFFGEDKSKPKDYTGARDAAGITSFIQQELGSGGGSALVKPLTYLETHTFLHADKLPSVLYFATAKSAPSWLTSLAVKFKEGKKRTLAVAHVHHDLHPGIARNFGVTQFPAVLLAVPPADGMEGFFVPFEGDAVQLEKPASALKAVKDFVTKALEAGAPGKTGKPLPSFPPPDVPRKVADVSLAQLTDDNQDSACFDSRKSICCIAFVKAAGDEFAERAELEALAKRFRNDPISFVFFDPSSTVALKHGKRNRYALFEGPLALKPAGEFLDKVLGGDQQFKAIAELPKLEPAYLRDD